MIFADNAATTKISEEAFKQMLPFIYDQYGNPSSQYSLGIKAKIAVNKSRQQVAAAIGAEASEIFFTSGGSECNNWVISSINEGHVITSSIEHYSVLKACLSLENKDIDVTYLPVDKKGRVSFDCLKDAIRPDTKLVSIMFANNEIGTIQPISEIGRYLQSLKIPFHCDAVQAVGHIPVNVKNMCIDLLTASSHKFYGPKGIGFLYKRHNIALPPFLLGGKQEFGMRAGTENVAGIVATGSAITECINDIEKTAKKISELTRWTIDGIRSKLPNIIVNGDENNRLPGIINITLDGVSGESIMHILDMNGICVSTSSACTSQEADSSHVLKSIGLSEKQARCSIRISYGKYNTMEEAEIIVNSIYNAYNKISSI